MYCPQCGTGLPDAAAPCPACGTPQPPQRPEGGGGTGGRRPLAHRLPTAPEQHWAVPDAVSTLIPQAPAHRRRQFWRAFLVGSAVLTAWGGLAVLLPVPSLTIRLLVLGSLFVPVLFVFFMTSEGMTEEPPAVVLIEVFVGVALVGNLLALVLNSLLPFGLAAAGPIEEGIKFFGVIWLLRRRQYVSIMDGILFGAAAGMGFAASENLNYFFTAYASSGLQAVLNAVRAHPGLGLAAAEAAFNQAGLSGLIATFWVRSFLGPWMHGAWTAILAGVAWRESAAGPMRLDLRWIATFVAVAAIHSAWDLTAGPAAYVLFAVIVVVDLYALRALLVAAHRQELTRRPVGLSDSEADPATDAAAALCPGCGDAALPQAQFCRGCGRRLGAQPAGAAAPESAAPS